MTPSSSHRSGPELSTPRRGRGRVVDSFLFSEPYEADLLALKFELESPLVDEWVAIENSYSFQGIRTGHHLEELLATDERFRRYRDRVTTIVADRPVRAFPGSPRATESAFQVEFWQRNLVLEVLGDAAPEDWLIVSDVDEALDMTDARRFDTLDGRMERAAEHMLAVPTIRYWFDFDNRYAPLLGIPMATMAYLRSTGSTPARFRRQHCGDLAEGWEVVVGFEWSSCFDVEHIVRKLRTQSHSGLREEDLRRALRLNHRPHLAPSRPEATDRDLFETVVLDADNSPGLVRDQLDRLRTGNVDPDYLRHRRAEDPSLWRLRLHRVRTRARRVRRRVRSTAIYAVRHLGWRDFRLEPFDPGPSPWFDDESGTVRIQVRRQ